jgi:hypothetical protein
MTTDAERVERACAAMRRALAHDYRETRCSECDGESVITHHIGDQVEQERCVSCTGGVAVRGPRDAFNAKVRAGVSASIDMLRAGVDPTLVADDLERLVMF